MAVKKPRGRNGGRRKKFTGPTVAIRVPLAAMPEIEILLQKFQRAIK